MLNTRIMSESKFKVGDEVIIDATAWGKDPYFYGIPKDVIEDLGGVLKITDVSDLKGERLPAYNRAFDYGVEESAYKLPEFVLEPLKKPRELFEGEKEVMCSVHLEQPTPDLEKEGLEKRTFDSGAFRNSDEGKLGYEGFTNPLVMKKYAEFMSKNRQLEDGTLREPDNWQKGIPIQALMESGTRHFEDVKLHHRGHGDDAVEGYLDSIFGAVFNLLGMAHAEINLGEKSKWREDK